MASIHPITAYRRKYGLSSTQFAEDAGVDRSCLSRVETGHRDRLGADANLRVEEFTKGEVTLKQLTAWHWPKSSTKKTAPKRGQSAA